MLKVTCQRIQAIEHGFDGRIHRAAGDGHHAAGQQASAIQALSEMLCPRFSRASLGDREPIRRDLALHVLSTQLQISTAAGPPRCVRSYSSVCSGRAWVIPCRHCIQTNESASVRVRVRVRCVSHHTSPQRQYGSGDSLVVISVSTGPVP